MLILELLVVGGCSTPLRAPMPSFVQEYDCASFDIDGMDFGLTQSNF